MPENNAIKDKETIQELKAQIEELKKQLKEKDKQIQEYLGQIKRINADFFNYRKRQEEERVNTIKYANLELLREVINVVDHFERIVDSLEKGHKIEDIKTGMNLVLQDIKSILKRVNVKEIETKDKEFNPQYHEVVEFGNDKDKENGVILQELRKGYTLEERLIRPALVKVNKKENE